MDGADLILNNPVTPLTVFTAEHAKTEKTEQLAKDFESVLLTKLVDEMKETAGKWDLEEEEDAASGQVQGLFWMYLAQDLGDKGGLGLWKDLHRFFTDVQSPAEPPQSVDESL
jgi:Rod binding domain-containing protein